MFFAPFGGFGELFFCLVMMLSVLPTWGGIYEDDLRETPCEAAPSVGRGIRGRYRVQRHHGQNVRHARRVRGTVLASCPYITHVHIYIPVAVMLAERFLFTNCVPFSRRVKTGGC